jgi:phosphohistidine phosphatase
MKLFFLRHGEAGTASHDDLRELTARGRVEVARVASGRRANLQAVQWVLVSPIVRAQQTADIACADAGLDVPVRTVEWLIHETPVAIALAEIAKIDCPVLLVGHQPLAGLLVERLTGNRIPIGTGNLIEMEGEVFAPGFVSLVHHAQP